MPRYIAARYIGPHVPALYTSMLGVVRLVEREPHRLPGPAWVRVRPLLAGICGSDLATLTAQGSTYFAPFTSCPFVLGHEVVGVVEETGHAVAGLRAGDRVVLQPVLHCAVRGIDPPCAACAGGDLAHCRNVRRGILSAGIQTGYCRDTGGGWSQGFVAHEQQLHLVPASLPDEIAVLVEPFACCLHAVLAAPAAMQPDATVLVLGAGTIGALTLIALRATGSRARVVVVAKHAHQQELARRLGADVVLGTQDLRPALARALDAELHQPELGGPVALGGARACFECVGSDRSLDEALRFTDHHGTVVLVGMPAVPRAIDWTGIWHKELVVRGAYTSTTPTFRQAIELADAGRERLRGIAGARFPLGRWHEAIRCALHAGREGVVKTVFEP